MMKTYGKIQFCSKFSKNHKGRKYICAVPASYNGCQAYQFIDGTACSKLLDGVIKETIILFLKLVSVNQTINPRPTLKVKQGTSKGSLIKRARFFKSCYPIIKLQKGVLLTNSSSRFWNDYCLGKDPIISYSHKDHTRGENWNRTLAGFWQHLLYLPSGLILGIHYILVL